jgi:enamine deaminase RidA (YjgF/YER057c/UK114 family)
MTIRRIHSGGVYESQVGYCRAVVAGGWVHVSGTVGEGDTIEAQCESALVKIEQALQTSGAGFANVVRVTYMLADAQEFERCWPCLRTYFGAYPPAATMIECVLIAPQYRIEIEVTALLPD